MARATLAGIAVSLAGCSFQASAGGDGGAPAIDAPTTATTTCDGAWCLRKSITIHAAQVSGGPLANFPVLVSLATDDDLRTGARDDGDDLLFTAADGTTKLAYEREIYDPLSGHLIAWVNVPALSSTTDDVIYLYWGNAAASDQQDVAHTWDASFQGVWHLDDVAASTVDATTNANTGSAAGGVSVDPDGTIGTARAFDGTGDIKIPASAGLSATSSVGTFGMWVSFVNPASGSFQSLLSSTNSFPPPTGPPGPGQGGGGGPPPAADGYSWAQDATGDDYFYPWVGDNNDFNRATVDPFAHSGWHYAVVTLAFASTTVAIYVDGAPLALTTTNVPQKWRQTAMPADWFWGGNPAAPMEYFAGSLDEIRVANVVRSPGWIATEYRNQHAPSSFYALGAKEMLSP